MFTTTTQMQGLNARLQRMLRYLLSGNYFTYEVGSVGQKTTLKSTLVPENRTLTFNCEVDVRPHDNRHHKLFEGFQINPLAAKRVWMTFIGQ